MTRRLFTAFGLSAMIAVSAGFPAAAQPDPRPGIGDFLDPNRSGGLFANIGIAGLRAVTELEYQHLSTDVLRGQIALSGVTLRPALAYDRTRLCSVEIDRLVLQSDPNLEVFDTSAITATLIGTRADMFCLPPDVQVPLRGAGYSAIELDLHRFARPAEPVVGPHEDFFIAGGAVNVQRDLDPTLCIELRLEAIALGLTGAAK